MRTQSSYIKIVCLNVLLLFLLLIVLEIYFGNWFNPNRLNKLNIVKDVHIQYSLQGLYPSENAIITYTRDKWGFRGKYPDLKNIDILTVGGSTTDQRFISDGYTFQDVLQKEFKDNGKDVYIVNAGVDGQSTFGHMKNFDWWFPHIPELKVKYFLFYIGGNDFHKNDNFQYDILLQEYPVTIIGKIKKYIRERSALYYLFRTSRGIIKANAYGLSHNADHGYYGFSTKDWIDQPGLSNYTSIMQNNLDAYEQRLNILCEKVKSFGAKSIFVTHSKRRTYDIINGRLFGTPSLSGYEDHYYNGVDYYYMVNLLHERTKEVCKKNDCIFIDADKEIDFDIKTDFYDNIHNTPSGAEKIGKYLYRELKHLFK